MTRTEAIDYIIEAHEAPEVDRRTAAEGSARSLLRDVLRIPEGNNERVRPLADFVHVVGGASRARALIADAERRVAAVLNVKA